MAGRNRKLSPGDIELIKVEYSKGWKVKDIAEKFGVSEKTLRRAIDFKSIKKVSSDSNEDTATADDTSTTTFDYSKIIANLKEPDDKSANWRLLAYPTKEYLHKLCPDCKYDGSEGYGLFDEECLSELQATGLMFVMIVHYKCNNPDGTVKKPHIHFVVHYDNRTTKRNVANLCRYTKGPEPKRADSLRGSVCYLTHADNPEKTPYDENELKLFNGFTMELSEDDEVRIKDELTFVAITTCCETYADIVIEAKYMGSDCLRVVQNNTYYFTGVTNSIYHNSIGLIMRYLEHMPGDDPKRQDLIDALKEYGAKLKDKKEKKEL